MNVELTLPSGWHQVQADKLVNLAKLFLSHREKPDFLVRCFFLFSGWNPLTRREFQQDGKRQYWFKTKNQKFYIDADLITSLVKQLEWIVSGIGLPAGMPEIRGFSHCNYKLYNVSLEKFLEADNFYNAWAEKNDSHFLDKLFTVFYTRQRWFSWPSKAEKYAVFLWFTGVKAFLVNKYPYLFSGSSDASGFPSPEETILNLLSALNLGNVTHNPKIFKTHVHECFYELNLKIEHAPKNK